MKIETITELNAAIDTLAVMMADKGIVSPYPKFEFEQGFVVVWLHASSMIGSKDCWNIHASNATDGYNKAADIIASLPSAEEKATHDYLAKIARAVDFAKDNGIDDEYVKPLRDVTCAMTDNLLTKVEQQ